MKQWQETAAIFSRVADIEQEGARCALATVVHIRGSAYRRAGAKFLIEETGATVGGVSGGCLEADVRAIGRTAIEAGTATLRHYDTGSDEDTVWGLGLGCNGEVDVFIQPVGGDRWTEVTAALRDLLRGDRPFAVSTVIDGPGDTVGACVVVADGGIQAGSSADGTLDAAVLDHARACLAAGGTGLLETGDARVFTEVHVPPPRLVLFGAGDDARPLAAIAATAGFRVTVVDHRPAFIERDRFPVAAARILARSDEGLPGVTLDHDVLAVIMTHSLSHDTNWARLVAGTPVPYIGLLGPRARTDGIVEEIGVDPERVFGPVGLDIGADGPEQVAVSVVSELLAFCARRAPGHLRDRHGAIHAV